MAISLAADSLRPSTEGAEPGTRTLTSSVTRRCYTAKISLMSLRSPPGDLSFVRSLGFAVVPEPKNSAARLEPRCLQFRTSKVNSILDFAIE